MKHAVLLVLALGLSACGGQGDKTNVGLGWNPADVRISCPSGDCPDAAGVLIFAKRGPTGFRLARCTATLIAADTIITNAHCDDGLPDHSHAFFIKADGSGNTVAASVGSKTYEYLGPVSGIDRDMAIFKLNRALPGAPKSIARHIPERMDKLIAYSIDQSYWDTDFTSFNLNKKTCRVDKTMPLFGGGSEDMTLGIALFDCDVKQGNSGSAMYAPGDTQNIQALLNTLWTWKSQKGKASERLRSMFFETPEFMKKDYGMAERLHCANVPNQAPPAQLCTKVSIDKTVGDKYRVAAALRIDQWLNSMPSGTGGVEWTLETIDGVLNEGGFAGEANPAAVLIPVPYCSTGEFSATALRVPYFRLGLLASGGADARLVKEMEMSVRFARTVGNGSSPAQVTVSSVWRDTGRARFEVSRSARARHGELTSTYRALQIPPCTSQARVEARQKALEILNNTIRVVEDGLMVAPN